ncbi:hypothetical protein NDK43_20385 [Neobacillus pocheonensis]|uniref:Uncharacterized protein n=1 Tax=Neobacillus pocheonensis TaxID=363869 RepID=A0ABT0WD95_9BACI|nr:hypothetical protein [Neobacillus pocheonensis]
MGKIMMLKKIVEEFETIKRNLNEARRQFGKYHHIVTEYQKQLDELSSRYSGVINPSSSVKKEK